MVLIRTRLKDQFSILMVCWRLNGHCCQFSADATEKSRDRCLRSDPPDSILPVSQDLKAIMSFLLHSKDGTACASRPIHR